MQFLPVVICLVGISIIRSSRPIISIAFGSCIIHNAVATMYGADSLSASQYLEMENLIGIEDMAKELSRDPTVSTGSKHSESAMAMEFCESGSCTYHNKVCQADNDLEPSCSTTSIVKVVGDTISKMAHQTETLDEQLFSGTTWTESHGDAAIEGNDFQEESEASSPDKSDLGLAWSVASVQASDPLITARADLKDVGKWIDPELWRFELDREDFDDDDELLQGIVYVTTTA